MFLRILTTVLIISIFGISIITISSAQKLYEDYYIYIKGEVNWTTEHVKEAGGKVRLICRGSEVTSRNIERGSSFSVSTMSHTSALPDCIVRFEYHVEQKLQVICEKLKYKVDKKLYRGDDIYCRFKHNLTVV